MAYRIRHNRALIALALAIVVAVVAIVIPTCRMVGCSMSGGSMSWGHSMLPGFYGDCGGTYMTSEQPSAVVPSTVDALVLVLVAAMMVAIVLYRPQVAVRRITSHPSDPPPPPENPLGTRFRV